MLSLEEIKNNYSHPFQTYERHILREYLQYKILEIIYSSKFGSKLVFMGGTALRVVYDNQRFSEDLDFDNKGVNKEEFTELSEIIKDNLEKEGLKVEIKLTFKEAFRCYIKIKELLFEKNITPHTGEKLTIQVDTFPQEYNYTPNYYNLDKFDVYKKIKVAPLSLILSQKIYCIFNRNRRMGRDFFDIDFIINNKKESPDWNYLKQKIGITKKKELKERLKKEVEDINFEKLAEKTSFLLLQKEQVKRIENFYKKIKTWNL